MSDIPTDPLPGADLGAQDVASADATPAQVLQEPTVYVDLGEPVQPPEGVVFSFEVEPRRPVEAPTNLLTSRFEDIVSGEFDAEDQEEPAPPKRVLAPMADTPKLHKLLAQSGIGSRLEMEQLILEGRISVNNEPAHIGQRIQFGDSIKVNGKPIRFRIDPPPPRVIAYHKPAGEVVTHDDPQNRPTVFRKLPRLQHGKWQSVGRLDLNTEGLMLFTNSGELANNLMHPRFGLEREYAVRVLGALSKDEKQALLGGVRLDDGVAQFGAIEEGGGEGANCWYRVTISEGRNREVRRMLESVGHAVSRLIRIRYGAMVLPRGLRRGAFMELGEGDIRSLFQAARPQRSQKAQPGDAGSDSASPAVHPGPRSGETRPRKKGSSNLFARTRRSDRKPSRTDGSDPGAGSRGDKAATSNHASRSAAQQPDPMKTSLGYIGADSFNRQRREGASRGGAPNQGNRRGGRNR